MRRVLALTVSCVVTVSVFGVPAYPGWQVRELENGSEVKLRLVGDEFYYFWETENGKIALEQNDGRFVVTAQDRPNDMQIRAQRLASAKHQRRLRQGIGDRNFAPRGLVILVEFDDVQFQAENNKAGFNDMLNKEGYDYDGATGSAVDYFKAQSNGQYAPSFDVFGPIKLPHAEEYYGEEGIGDKGEKESDLYLADFVIDAIFAADKEGCDFSQYDSDNNGEVDIVYLFYAGKGQADGGESWTIWPHNWELISALYYVLQHEKTDPTYYAYYDEQYKLHYNLPVIDGKIIDAYVCSGELNGSGNRSGIGTLCHEFSHVLGLPDYYDTDYGDNSTNRVTPNYWSLMDAGSYGNGGKTPPNYSIYDKYFMGWATPKLLAKDSVANIVLYTGYDEAYQINGGKTLLDYTSTQTIYYIENRQKEGWDAYLPGHGLLVWKVTYDADAWKGNRPNNEAGNPLITVVSAREGAKIGLPSSDYNPFPGSDNVTSFTPLTGCELTEIQEGVAGLVQFKYNGGINGHSIYGSTVGCSIKPSTPTAMNGEDLKVAIIPQNKTYDFDSIRVFFDHAYLVETTDYTMNATNDTLTVKGSAITGSDDVMLIILAYCSKNRYSYGVLQDPEVCTISSEEGMVEKEAKLQIGVKVSEGYVLDSAACWEVEMGDKVLVYGTDFVYAKDSITIAKVTGDVGIYIYPAKIVSWIVEGVEFDSNLAINGKITLPTGKPTPCKGNDFTGWCSVADYSSTNKAPTYAKANDAVNAAGKYYAVFANNVKDGNRTVYQNYSTTCVEYTPQGVDNVQSDNVQCTKVLRDGQLLIIHGEHVYTTTGSRIR